MNCLASKRISSILVAQSYFFSTTRETVRLCMGESKIPHLRLRTFAPNTSENYTCIYMSLNIKRRINFLIRHIIY